MSAVKSSSDKRRPEGTSGAMFVAHRLHQLAAKVPAAKAEPARRIAGKLGELRLDSRSARAFRRAAARDLSCAEELLSSPALSALAPEVRSAVARAVERAGDPASRAALSSLIAEAGFRALRASIQASMLDRFDAPVAESWLLFAAAPAFGALDVEEQQLFLEWGAGPAVAEERREIFDRLAEQRTAELRELCERAEADARAWRSFLFDPCRSVHFLEADEVGGHRAISVGDPADRRALSYGLRAIPGLSRRQATIHSPDPLLVEGLAALDRYTVRSAKISRREEHLFVCWAERSFVLITPGATALRPGPQPVSLHHARFFDLARRVLTMFCAHRGGACFDALDPVVDALLEALRSY